MAKSPANQETPRNKYADDTHLSNPEFEAAAERLLSACKFYWQDVHGYDKDVPYNEVKAMADETLNRIGLDRL